MVSTRSKTRTATPVSEAPSSPTTSIKLSSPLQSPEPPARPLKRKRNKDAHYSPVPTKLRNTTSTPLEASRPRTLSWISDLASEADFDAPCPQDSSGSDRESIATFETDEPDVEQDPVFGPKLFRQAPTAKDWSDIGRHKSLEYFQAFPHDQHSTLCPDHFLSLVDKWYWQRKPTVDAQLNAMTEGRLSEYYYSDLALPLHANSHTVMDAKSFKARLKNEIRKTYMSFVHEFNRAYSVTGYEPSCEIFDKASSLACCTTCAQSPGYQLPMTHTHEDASWGAPEYPGWHKRCKRDRNRMISTLLKCCHYNPITILGTDEATSYTECEDCGHRQDAELGENRPWKQAIEIAGVRFPVEVVPKGPMAVNSKCMHVDLGGIHIVVDWLAGNSPLIKFRSTRFSEAHEKEGFDFHDQNEIEVLGVPMIQEDDNPDIDTAVMLLRLLTHQDWHPNTTYTMRLFGGKNNKFKVDPPKIRIEKVVVDRPAQKPKPKPNPALSGSASRSSSSHRPSPKPVARQASHSPYPSSSDEKRLERKRKAPSVSRKSPASDRIEFDKDSDGEDDGWMTLDTKRQRKGTEDGGYVDPNRKLRSVRAFEERIESRSFIHAVDVASLEHKCVPVMGAQKEEVAIRLQYPSLQPREKYELVWGKDKIDAVEASIKVVRHVAETYLTEEEAEPFTNPNGGIIRRLEKASNRNIQDLMGFKAALREYNEKLRALVDDGVIAKNLDKMHELPQHLVAFILDQIYDRTVALKVELLSKYENGTDYVYGELLHPFISKILVEQTRMTSGQVFVDLGSGVGNVVLQAALEIGCESWGCEMMENACNLADEQKKEFDARCMLWGVRPGKVHLERGDFRKNARIHEALKRADVVLVNNKAFTSQLNDDLVRMFLDLKSGCKVVSLKSFVAEKSNNHNINDVGSTILEVEECIYPEGYVSWTNAGGPYFISTRK
ncbi:histone-lysine n- h3 lysine-79 specific [Fusarium longipes]|uniref:Histone-lysine N-methyltransferase, H3 lysine-79 specific n=1 Tax=Fusarium longipes TaxID=694270 RepID=A0A395STK5_9HYPO|nr:histone-lysine n- h3 lysine-79 specific [Fusarium longipes]